VAWVKLYHKLPNWKETICIVIHDFGYWNCVNIDGPEGELHPLVAARWVYQHLDGLGKYQYGHLCAFHSRTIAKKYNIEPSLLCAADKLGSALTPVWLMVLLGNLSGEIKELHLNPKYPSYRRTMTDYEMMRDFSQHYRAKNGNMKVEE
jgi:hypothetical protein